MCHDKPHEHCQPSPYLTLLLALQWHLIEIGGPCSTEPGISRRSLVLSVRLAIDILSHVWVAELKIDTNASSRLTGLARRNADEAPQPFPNDD